MVLSCRAFHEAPHPGETLKISIFNELQSEISAKYLCFEEFGSRMIQRPGWFFEALHTG
jgi:hypothetical protein